MDTRKLIAYLLILAIFVFLAAAALYLTRDARARNRAGRRHARKWRERALAAVETAGTD